MVVDVLADHVEVLVQGDVHLGAVGPTHLDLVGLADVVAGLDVDRRTTRRPGWPRRRHGRARCRRGRRPPRSPTRHHRSRGRRRLPGWEGRRACCGAGWCPSVSGLSRLPGLGPAVHPACGDLAECSLNACRAASGEQVARPGPVTGAGSRTTNRAPPRSDDDTATVPPWAATISLTIASPSPLPPASRARASSSRTNRSKTRWRCPRGSPDRRPRRRARRRLRASQTGWP